MQNNTDQQCEVTKAAEKNKSPLLDKIPFNKPYNSPLEIANIIDSINKGKISGDGHYTKLCNEWFLENINRKILLTHSCTAALEMMALLLNLSTEDEIIMPSYTFVSTANAFVLRGAKPVFVDIRPDTLNINENLIEQAISPKTKAIMTVHYAGVGCEMDKIKKIAQKHNLYLLEDAAQGFGSKYNDKPLGTIGNLGTYSFHETKNIISGEGGALIINDEQFIERAEIIREKGTNRSKFFRGEVDKYTWVDKGSSYLPSDIIAAFLYGQLQYFEQINNKRLMVWKKYHEFFDVYEKKGVIKRPFIPANCIHNAHMYYLIFNDLDMRTKFINYMNGNDILTVFHYIPLHSSPAGLKLGSYVGDMSVTTRISDTLVRLPLFYSLESSALDYIIEKIKNFMDKI
jgi:dTDP-4-amino-4,6-dideoxygalactose transaminase